MTRLRSSSDQLLFGIALIVFMASIVLERTAWASRPEGMLNEFAVILKAMRYMAYLLAVIKFIKVRIYPQSVIFILLLVMTVVTAGMFSSNEKAYFLFMFICCAAIGMNSRYLIACTFATQLIISLVVLTGVLTGVVEDYIWINRERLQHFLGFNYSNTLPGIYFFLLLQYLYLKKGKLTFKGYLPLMLLAFGLYQKTTSRLNFIMSACVLSFFLFYNKWFASGKIIKKHKKTIMCLPFLVAVLSMVVATIYNESVEIWRKLDSLLSNRLSLSHSGLLKYKITIFGQSINWIGNTIESLTDGYKGNYNYVDNAYIKMLLDNGILFSLLILLMYAILLKKSIERKEFYLTWVIIFILIHSVVEARLVNFGMNPFILLAATELPQSNMQSMKKREIGIRLKEDCT